MKPHKVATKYTIQKAEIYLFVVWRWTFNNIYKEQTFKISSHIRSLMIGAEMVPETLVSFDHLTPQEDFTKYLTSFFCENLYD
jgi:hypothetical protein